MKINSSNFHTLCASYVCVELSEIITILFIDFLLGCEVTPEVNLNKEKYHIKLTIPGPDMYEMEMGCTSDKQYVKWMAACRLASKGKTMADPTYEMEMSGVKTFLNMQNDVKESPKDDDYDAGAHVSSDLYYSYIPTEYMNILKYA